MLLFSACRDIKDEEQSRIGHLFFYLADENESGLRLSQETLDIHRNSLLTSGSRVDVGTWQLHLKSQVVLDRPREHYEK